MSGLSQHALLVDVAAKVLADNLAAMLNQARALGDETHVALTEKSAARQRFNRAHATKLLSRWTGPALLQAKEMAQCIHE